VLGASVAFVGGQCSVLNEYMPFALMMPSITAFAFHHCTCLPLPHLQPKARSRSVPSSRPSARRWQSASGSLRRSSDNQQGQLFCRGLDSRAGSSHTACVCASLLSRAPTLPHPAVHHGAALNRGCATCPWGALWGWSWLWLWSGWGPAEKHAWAAKV